MLFTGKTVIFVSFMPSSAVFSPDATSRFFKIGQSSNGVGLHRTAITLALVIDRVARFQFLDGIVPGLVKSRLLAFL